MVPSRFPDLFLMQSGGVGPYSKGDQHYKNVLLRHIGLECELQDFSTLSRRQKTLAVTIRIGDRSSCGSCRQSQDAKALPGKQAARSGLTSCPVEPRK